MDKRTELDVLSAPPSLVIEMREQIPEARWSELLDARPDLAEAWAADARNPAGWLALAGPNARARIAALEAESVELKHFRVLFWACAEARDKAGYVGTVPDCIADLNALSTSVVADRARLAEQVKDLREALEPFAGVEQCHPQQTHIAVPVEWLANARAILTRTGADRDRLSAENAELREALKDATAHLVGAASAYRRHAARSRSVGRAVPDALFTTRASDFDNAASRARAILTRTGADRE